MRALAAFIALALAGACKAPGDGAPDASASPQASAVPAPLATAPQAVASAAPAAPEGGPPPSPLRSDERLAGDSYVREAAGYALSAVFRPADVVLPPRAPEINAVGLEAARHKADLTLAIDLTASRMRVVLAGKAFVLPPDTEIRARSDRFGHIVVWPGNATYRSLAPGSLRALLGERRFDVAPIGDADVVPTNEAGKRIGVKTRKVEISTRAAKATFEIGRLEGLGEGGTLVCRLLLDLMNAAPKTPACGFDEIPMRAELRWTGHGALGFEVTGVLRKSDMQVPLLVPPPTASFTNAPPPGGGVQPLLTEQELAAFRSGPVDVPEGTGGGTIGDGLVVANATLQLRMLYVDGVPIAWAAPGARDTILGLQRGKYLAQWRTFLGDAVEPPVLLTVPGIAQIGGGDAGVR